VSLFFDQLDKGGPMTVPSVRQGARQFAVTAARPPTREILTGWQFAAVSQTFPTNY
jgi:hypothetical protein